MELRLEQIKAALLFCDSKHPRYDKVFFDGGYMVATDGVIMLVQRIVNDISVFSLYAKDFEGIKDEKVTVTPDGFINERIKVAIMQGDTIPWKRLAPESLDAIQTH